MDFKLGFIGTGNMGAAIIKGVIKSGVIDKGQIFAYDLNEEKLGVLQAETGINTLSSPAEVVAHSDVIILAVKPNGVQSVLEGSKAKFQDSKVLVSIAVGIPIKFYKDIIGYDQKVIRAMPNTPALVGEGMTLLSYEGNVKEDEISNVQAVFASIGKVESLEEKLMNEVTALTGSSPAYVFMFIEAMADAAVLSGLPRELAYKLAAQAVLGSAKMVLETGKHPGELKDQVCSPAGTTIEAVKSLEENGLRFAVMEAMEVCTKRAREIGKIYG